MTSGNDTARVAATRLPRSKRARPMASSVLSPHNGIKPKKIPTAAPSAIARGASLTRRSCSYLSRNQLMGVTTEMLANPPARWKRLTARAAALRDLDFGSSGSCCSARWQHEHQNRYDWLELVQGKLALICVCALFDRMPLRINAPTREAVDRRRWRDEHEEGTARVC